MFCRLYTQLLCKQTFSTAESYVWPIQQTVCSLHSAKVITSIINWLLFQKENFGGQGLTKVRIEKFVSLTKAVSFSLFLTIKWKPKHFHSHATNLHAECATFKCVCCILFLVKYMSNDFIYLRTSTKVSSLTVRFCRLVTLCQHLRFVVRFWRYIN